MSFIVFDTGALIAIERGNRRLQALLERLRASDTTVLVPAGVAGQAWRDGSRQARLAMLLAAPQTRLVELDGARARASGVLLGRAGTKDVIGASVVVCAREHGKNIPVVTADCDDLRVLDPHLNLVAI